MGMGGESRPALRLFHGRVEEPARWLWFCGYCAARWQNSEPPRPVARVCLSCGLGLLLHAREDVAPGERDAFLVVDRSLRVQALSRRAETLLGLCEEGAVQRPIGELLVCADAEAQPFGALADAVMHANADWGGPVRRVGASRGHFRAADESPDRGLRPSARDPGRAAESG